MEKVEFSKWYNKEKKRFTAYQAETMKLMQHAREHDVRRAKESVERKQALKGKKA